MTHLGNTNLDWEIVRYLVGYLDPTLTNEGTSDTPPGSRFVINLAHRGPIPSTKLGASGWMGVIQAGSPVSREKSRTTAIFLEVQNSRVHRFVNRLTDKRTSRPRGLAWDDRSTCVNVSFLMFHS